MRHHHTPRLACLALAGALLAGAGAVPATAAPAAAADDLFISEYVEGTGNTKALEVANLTGAQVDLTGWQVRAFHNGRGLAQGPSFTIRFPARTLAHGAVHVVANPNASAATLAVADQTDTGVQFNGDDALLLVDPTGRVVDAFGRVGEDPGVAWTSADGAVSTLDQTLHRRDLTRDVDPLDPFDPSVRFDAAPVNDVSDLGRTPSGAGGDDPAPSGPCAVAATPIHAVQGSGPTSPLVGGAVTVRGVVTAVFDGLGGYAIQTPDAEADADPATSEGVFVSDPGRNVARGDEVAVTGTVREQFGQTEVRAVTAQEVCATGVLDRVSPRPLPLPSDDTTREGLESTWVTLDDVVVTDLFDTARFGEVLLAAGRVLDSPTEVAEPGPAAQAVAGANAARSIRLDDGTTRQNPSPVPYAQDTVVRRGDGVELAAGAVLGFGFGAWRLQPIGGPAAVSFDVRNPRPAAPAVVGTRTVASFNVLNYFLAPNTGAPVCGPTRSSGCRGARDAADLAAQRSKLLDTLEALDADVVGLVEVENAPDDAAVADLVTGLNERAGRRAWDLVRTGPIGTDAIRVALVHRTGTATPVGPPAVLDGSVDPRFRDDRNRPVLAQTFDLDGELVTVAVTHLKSKGSPCADLGDPDTGDGQGNCNGTRTAAMAATVDWLEADPTGTGAAGALLVGDVNAYGNEDPIRVLRDAGWVDTLDGLDPADRYSYVFAGAQGRLDHAFASPGLAPAVSGAAVWHANADEPRAYDYDTRFEPLVAPGPVARVGPRPARGRHLPGAGADPDPHPVGAVAAGGAAGRGRRRPHRPRRRPADGRDVLRARRRHLRWRPARRRPPRRRRHGRTARGARPARRRPDLHPHGGGHQRVRADDHGERDRVGAPRPQHHAGSRPLTLGTWRGRVIRSGPATRRATRRRRGTRGRRRRCAPPPPARVRSTGGRTRGP